MNRLRNQNKLLLVAFILALGGVCLYFIDKGPSQTIGMTILTIAFLFYGGDAVLKYRMTKRAQFLFMAVFFYGLAAYGAYTTANLYF